MSFSPGAGSPRSACYTLTMARWIAILLLFAPVLAAHPFDDRCDMVAQLILQKSGKADEMVLSVQYRYETPYASYNEASLFLDADRDDHISRAELDTRCKTLASDLVASVYLSIRGDVASVEPDYKEFAFANLDDPDSTTDQQGGMPTRNLRIGYFFFFRVKPAFELGKGKHPVEFYLANRRVAITDAAEQLQAWDDRGPERKAVTTVKHDRTPDKYDRLTFLWEIEDAVSEVIPTVDPGVKDPEIKPEPEDPSAGGKEQLIETDIERRDDDGADNQIIRAMEQLRDFGADPWVWLVVLGTMFVWGAIHALMPGHGKALVAGYLVGTRGTKVDALFLGLVVTAAHTSGVYLLLGGAWAFRTMWPGVLDNPEKQLAEWIAFAVGLTIFLMGATLLMKRAGGGAKHEHDIFGRHVHGDEHHHHDDDSDSDSDILHAHDHAHDHHHDHAHDHAHDHGHSHDHGHGHSHGRDPARMTRGEILRLGILGGVIPCPSAFIIGLFAFQWGMEVSGLIAVLAFSVGLALVLATIGLVLVQGKSYLAERAKDRPSGPLYRFLENQLPILGAMVITVIGVLLTTFALIRLDLIDPVKFTV
jgi:nickel/cobalt exporter